MAITTAPLKKSAHIAPFDPSVTIRAGVAADREAENRFWAKLSPASIYSRFFNASRTIASGLSMDLARRFVLLAEHDGEIVAIGEISPGDKDPKRAEVAFAVLESMQHHGIASRLLQELVGHARSRGIERLTATVLATNQLMLAVFRESGLVQQERLLSGEIDVTMPLGA